MGRAVVINPVFFLCLCVIIAVCISITGPTVAQAESKTKNVSVTGSLTIGKTTVNYKDGVAFKDKNGSLVVFLSDNAIDRKKVVSELKNTGRYSDFSNNLKLRFDSKGNLDFYYFYVKEGNKNMSSPPSGIKSQSTITKDHIKSHVFTEKMIKFMDEEYRFDVTFDVDIISY